MSQGGFDFVEADEILYAQKRFECAKTPGPGISLMTLKLTLTPSFFTHNFHTDSAEGFFLYNIDG
jgi:hypothetical protein